MEYQAEPSRKISIGYQEMIDMVKTKFPDIQGRPLLKFKELENGNFGLHGELEITY